MKKICFILILCVAAGIFWIAKSGNIFDSGTSLTNTKIFPTSSPGGKGNKTPEPSRSTLDKAPIKTESNLVTYFETHSVPKKPIKINNLGELRERRTEFWNLIEPNNFPNYWKGERPTHQEQEKVSFIKVLAPGTVKLNSEVEWETLVKSRTRCLAAENHIFLIDNTAAVSLYGSEKTLHNLENFLNKKVEITGFYAEGNCEGAPCFCYPGIFVKSFNSK